MALAPLAPATERWQHAVTLAGQKPLRFACSRPIIDGAVAPVDFHALLASPADQRGED